MAILITITIAIPIPIASCRANVSLGQREGAADGDGGLTLTPGSDVCANASDGGAGVAAGSSVAVAPLDPSRLGTLRALAAYRGMVVGAFANAGAAGAAGAVVAIASSTGGGNGFREVARVGVDPVAIAFDGIHAWVASQTSGEVHRVRISDGSVVIAQGQTGVSSIAVAPGGRAVWTLPTSDAIMTWDFAVGEPQRIATFPRAQSIASDVGSATLYVSGEHALAAFGRKDAAPRRLVSMCGRGALSVDRDAVYCIDDGSLFQVSGGADPSRVLVLQTLAVGIRGGAKPDVIVDRGSAFFRTEGAHGATINMLPIDRVGGPTVVEIVSLDTPSAMASDGCGLFYAGSATSLSRRDL